VAHGSLLRIKNYKRKKKEMTTMKTLITSQNSLLTILRSRSASILVALTLGAFALASAPTTFGVVPAPDGGYPGGNTAEGDNALFSLTTGANNADNLSKAGWSWGCVATVDREGRTIFVADAYRDDGERFVVRADEKLTAFVELESATRARDDSS
jgi:hypothetical protein